MTVFSAAVRGAAAVLSLTFALWGQDLDWSIPGQDAVSASSTTGKPLLIHYVAGPQAAVFAQELDRFWSSWPEWTKKLASGLIPLRVRSWDGPFPKGLPALPDGGRSSFLALWMPGTDTWTAVWSRVPPVLEVSHALRDRCRLPLADPYQTDLAAFEVADGRDGIHRLDRESGGPGWIETDGTTKRLWNEEGPLGTLLILKDPASAQKLALPLESDWAFISTAATQSWSPWFQVTAIRP